VSTDTKASEKSKSENTEKLDTNKVPVFILESGFKGAESLVKQFEGDEHVKIYQNVKLQSLAPVIRKLGGGLIVGSLHKKEEAIHCLNILKSNKKLKKLRKIDALFITSKEVEFLTHHFNRLGVREILPEGSPEKSVQFKLRRMIQQLKPLFKQKGDKKEKEDGLKNGKGLGKGKKDLSKEVEYVSAMKIRSDYWLLKGGGAKMIMGRWMVNLVGPGPLTGKWVQSETEKNKKGEPLWEWILDEDLGKSFNLEPGTWFFDGRRPEFKQGQWVFVSNTPRLFFKREEKVIGVKVLAREEKGLAIANDSMSGKMLLREVIKSHSLSKKLKTSDDKKEKKEDENENSKGEEKSGNYSKGVFNDKTSNTTEVDEFDILCKIGQGVPVGNEIFHKLSEHLQDRFRRQRKYTTKPADFYESEFKEEIETYSPTPEEKMPRFWIDKKAFGEGEGAWERMAPDSESKRSWFLYINENQLSEEESSFQNWDVYWIFCGEEDPIVSKDNSLWGFNEEKAGGFLSFHQLPKSLKNALLEMTENEVKSLSQKVKDEVQEEEKRKLSQESKESKEFEYRQQKDSDESKELEYIDKKDANEKELEYREKKEEEDDELEYHDKKDSDSNNKEYVDKKEKDDSEPLSFEKKQEEGSFEESNQSKSETNHSENDQNQNNLSFENEDQSKNNEKSNANESDILNLDSSEKTSEIQNDLNEVQFSEAESKNATENTSDYLLEKEPEKEGTVLDGTFSKDQERESEDYKDENKNESKELNGEFSEENSKELNYTDSEEKDKFENREVFQKKCTDLGETRGIWKTGDSSEFGIYYGWINEPLTDGAYASVEAVPAFWVYDGKDAPFLSVHQKNEYWNFYDRDPIRFNSFEDLPSKMKDFFRFEFGRKDLSVAAAQKETSQLDIDLSKEKKNQENDFKNTFEKTKSELTSRLGDIAPGVQKAIDEAEEKIETVQKENDLESDQKKESKKTRPASPDKPAYGSLSIAFLVSELMLKRGVEPGYIFHKYCEYLSIALGKLDVETWCLVDNNWNLMGSSKEEGDAIELPEFSQLSLKNPYVLSSGENPYLVLSIFSKEVLKGGVVIRGEGVEKINTEYGLDCASMLEGITLSSKTKKVA
tara:strand:+ start:3409 stop:6750 length:3342 start_codon:yes stop_codon:yes gene_type:complete